MLEHVHLENFKASRDVEVRLAPITVLAGVNSSGKSTLLQALGALRQSYDANGVMTGLRLTGHLVQLGRYRDVLNEGTEGEAIKISVLEDGIQHWWSFQDEPEASQLRRYRASALIPKFVLTPNFQFLQSRSDCTKDSVSAGSSGSADRRLFGYSR